MASKTPIVRNVGRPTLVQEAIAIYLQKVSKKIKEDQEQKDLVASGESLNSHVITINKNNNILEAASYYPFIVRGRGPGKQPPPGVILDWLTERNIQPRDEDMSLKSLAYLIGRKMGREGSSIFRGEKEGIDLFEIATEREGVLYRQIARVSADQVTVSILNTFRKNPNYQVL